MTVYRLYLSHTRELYLETTSTIDLEATGQRLQALCVSYYIES
jgi:hypothetical protein